MPAGAKSLKLRGVARLNKFIEQFNRGPKKSHLGPCVALRIVLRIAEMNVPVRVPLVILAVASLLAVHSSQAQTTVSTNPVGYVEETLTPSSNGSSRAYSAVSYPLHQTPAWVGLVSSVSGDTITCSGSIPSGLTSSPYMVHVESSANAVATGQTFLITAAGTNSVTVSSPTFSVSSILTAGDQIAIRAAETLGSIFGSTNTNVQLQGGSSAGGSDVVYIWNGTNYNSYFYYPSYGWIQDGDATFTIQNNLPIYPDEGMLVGRISRTSLSGTYAASMGAVPSNNQTALVNAPGLTLISNPLPTAVTLSQFGFTNAPSWLEGESAGGSDVVYMWTGTGWQAYYYLSSYGWVEDGDSTFALQNNTPIAAGASVLVERRNAISAINAYIPIALNYTP
jgi:uncharacterized protein (TIGR02597 family)